MIGDEIVVTVLDIKGGQIRPVLMRLMMSQYTAKKCICN